MKYEILIVFIIIIGSLLCGCLQEEKRDDKNPYRINYSLENGNHKIEVVHQFYSEQKTNTYLHGINIELHSPNLHEESLSLYKEGMVEINIDNHNLIVNTEIQNGIVSVLINSSPNISLFNIFCRDGIYQQIFNRFEGDGWFIGIGIENCSNSIIFSDAFQYNGNYIPPGPDQIKFGLINNYYNYTGKDIEFVRYDYDKDNGIGLSEAIENNVSWWDVGDEIEFIVHRTSILSIYYDKLLIFYLIIN